MIWSRGYEALLEICGSQHEYIAEDTMAATYTLDNALLRASPRYRLLALRMRQASHRRRTHEEWCFGLAAQDSALDRSMLHVLEDARSEHQLTQALYISSL